MSDRPFFQQNAIIRMSEDTWDMMRAPKPDWRAVRANLGTLKAVLKDEPDLPDHLDPDKCIPEIPVWPGRAWNEDIMRWLMNVHRHYEAIIRTVVPR